MVLIRKNLLERLSTDQHCKDAEAFPKSPNGPYQKVHLIVAVGALQIASQQLLAATFFLRVDEVKGA
jgi:hypothetical protein